MCTPDEDKRLRQRVLARSEGARSAAVQGRWDEFIELRLKNLEEMEEAFVGEIVKRHPEVQYVAVLFLIIKDRGSWSLVGVSDAAPSASAVLRTRGGPSSENRHLRRNRERRVSSIIVNSTCHAVPRHSGFAVVAIRPTEGLRFIDRTLLVAVLAGTVHSKSGGCYMRALSIALLVLLTAVQASAEQSTADESAQLRRGARMIWTGVALIGAGALTVPITRDSQRSDGPLVAGSGLMFAGGIVIAFGMRERERALRPQHAFQLTLTPRTAAVRVSRRW